MKASIIITTYNAPLWLEKVLVGYTVQTFQEFEIIVADDGSTDETKKVIDSFKDKFKHPLQHIWQEDNGFQKPKILNKAILASKTEYLIFTDGDCIPRKDFVATHIKNAEIGYFLSGGYFKLPLEISQKITLQEIISQKCFSIKWLISNGLNKNFKLTKLTNNKIFAAFMNWLTPTKRSWNGHNSSGFKKDILAINGFNHSMLYGGLDRELGERLFNFGLLSKQIRYTAICIHLFHNRSYESKETWENNHKIRAFNKKNKITWIKNGIQSI